jgi:hypothetical protein
MACVRSGIERGDFIYQRGDLVFGKGDPPPEFRIDENSTVHTSDHARKLGIWPRAEPKKPSEFEGTKPIVGGDPKSPGAGDSPTFGRPGTAAELGLETFTAEAPLREALTQIVEQARKARVSAFSKINVRLFDVGGAWKVQQSIATLSDVEVQCEYSVQLRDDGIERFDTEFAGTLAKANMVKSLLERPLQAAKEKNFKAAFALAFTKNPLGTAPATADAFIAQITRFGAGEAYVEATAAPKEKKA